MAVLESLLILAVALVVMVKASEAVIEKSITVARCLRISELAIGFLLLSIATSLPEFVVSVVAALEGQVGLAVGNVFGSNLSNIALVAGVGAMVQAFRIRRKDALDLVRVLFITSVLPLIMLTNDFGRYAGVVLLLVFVGFVYFILKRGIAVSGDGKTEPRQAVLATLTLLAGVAVVIVSAKFAVDAAVDLSLGTGVSKAFVGATAVALGTSMPELALTLQAIRRKAHGLALGNLLGSAITNLTLVLGAAAVIDPLAANLATVFNLVVFALIANLVMWFFLQSGSKIGRNEGLVLVGVY
ncbi:MAG: sodium:calcium antiporter, partial [Candidatus Micrarchaeota archaeon]|nr:sodium:calcium antiporter [Candidatus Micrarchaeota archaeon]